LEDKMPIENIGIRPSESDSKKVMQLLSEMFAFHEENQLRQIKLRTPYIYEAANFYVKNKSRQDLNEEDKKRMLFVQNEFINGPRNSENTFGVLLFETSCGLIIRTKTKDDKVTYN